MLSIPTGYTEEAIEVRALNVTMPLQRMVDGYLMNRLDDLPPLNWSPASVNP